MLPKPARSWFLCLESRPRREAESSARQFCTLYELRLSTLHQDPFTFLMATTQLALPYAATCQAASRDFVSVVSQQPMLYKHLREPFTQKIMPHLLKEGDGRTRSLPRCSPSILPTFRSDVGCSSSSLFVGCRMCFPL